MRIPTHPDVVVLGGGVAGAAAARLLAGWGYLVLLVERDVERPPLAESLPPSCLPLLEQVGVREAVEAAGFVRGTGNTVWWGGAPMRVEPYAGGRTGFQVERGRLEQVLGAAAESAGAVRVRPATALRVERAARDGSDDAAHTITLALPDGEQVVRAPWVLDCTGRAGLLARAHRVPPPPGTRTLALVAVWERPDGWPLVDGTHTLVESAPWGWGWSVPLSETQRCFTAMVDPSRTPVGGDDQLLARYDALFAALPALGGLLEGARRVVAPWACDATPYHSREVAWPGMLLVGDAASMLDPLSSYGVKKALASAWLAAIVVHTARTTPAQLHAALALYREREAAYVQSANDALRDVSREAGGDLPFWSARAEAAPMDGGAVDVVAALRTAPDVLEAFARLRAEPALRLPPDDAYPRTMCPVVRGTVIVSEAHLLLRGVPEPVRYLRSIDLLALLELARRHPDVGELYAQYARQAGPVPLPDLLGALSVLLARSHDQPA